jgi:Flp pilus assembly protein TadG
MIRWPQRRSGGGLARNRSGTALIEFAVVMPILLVLFLASYETANLLIADFKLEAAAEAAADLVGQTTVNEVLQSTDLTNISNAAAQVMTPLPTNSSQLQIAYASVTYSTGTAVIDWHLEVNGATAISIGSLPNGATAANLGSQTSGSVDSVIVARLTYAYTSPFSYLLHSAYTLTESSFNRPRYLNCVPTYLNTNNVCP